MVYDWLDYKYPNNRLPVLVYGSLLGAARVNQAYNWKEELNKAFAIKEIDFNDLQNEDLVIEPVNDKGIQTIHFIHDHSVTVCSPDRGIIKINLELFRHLNFDFIRVLNGR